METFLLNPIAQEEEKTFCSQNSFPSHEKQIAEKRGSYKFSSLASEKELEVRFTQQQRPS